MSDLEYTIKKSKRARRVAISIHHTGDVIVTVPERASKERVAAFVQEKMPWILTTRERMLKHFEGKTPLKQSRIEYKTLKKQTLAFIVQKIRHYNQYYKFPYGRVSIRMQKSRWGSCSKKGNLNFNYKLIQLPEHLADYIVVHELCHLKEFNHGQGFWNLVAETIPDYKSRRDELRKKYVHIS